MRSALGIACLALVLSGVVCADDNKGWSWGGDSSNVPENVGPSAEDYVAAETSYSEQLDVVNATAIDNVVDEILVSNRQGRNIEGLDDIYKDPNIKQALDTGDDNQARNLIKDRLCHLGLMQCEGEYIDPKRSVAPEDLIYAQPVDIQPVGRPVPSIPVRGPPRAYGPPKPYGGGPPRKVGYSGPPLRPPGYGPPSKYGPPIPGPIGSGSFSSSSLNSFTSSGPTYLSKPPGPTYLSKPPGPIYDGSLIEGEIPYEFERPIKPGYVKEVKIGSASTLSGEIASVQQHVHHHYHHGDDKTKLPTVIVNNPVPVGSETHHSSSLSSGFQGGSSFGGSSSGGFGSGSSSGGFGGGSSSGGFSGVNSGGFNPVNSGFGSSGGLYAGVKPVYENTGSGYSGGVYKGSSQSGQAGVYNLGYASGASYAPSSASSNSFGSYSTNNQFYKKELNTSPVNSNQLGSGNYYSSNQYGSQFGYSGQESGRAESYDCVCVPYDQCPSQNIIGKRDDLFLPIDPRNLPKDIEALPDDKVVITDGNGTMSVVRVTKSANDNATNNEKVEATKKISKRETNDKASDSANKANISPRQSGSDDDESRGLFGKKIQPTFGVSFGLPHSGYGGYPLNPYGPNPIVNPYGSSIGGGGLNLGLINVDPLVSVQVTKNDYGEKVIKPLVNLHVTPNDKLVHKVGSYLSYKKQLLFNKPGLFGGGYGGGFGGHGGYPHQPGYVHNHYHYGPVRPPHHYGPPHHYERPRPPPFHGGFHSAYPGVYREHDYDDNDGFSSGPYVNDADEIGPFSGPGGFYGRSTNNQNPGNYAQNFNSYNRVQNDPAQPPIQADGGGNVKFPTSRRRRDTSQSDNEPRNKAEKRQAFYQPQQQQQQQQCGPRQVCCKRSYRPQQQQQQLQGPNRGQCGVRHSQGINGRIKNPVYVDGDSEFGEYPWQVAILKKDPKESVYVCGGTLIDHLHIVTAAHCVKTYTGFDLRVRLGEWDVNHDVEFYPYIERDVVSVHVHPQYYAGTLDNDLAILKLDHPVEWTKYPHISPACLPDKFTDYTGARCWTTGWGKDAFGDFGKYQNILKEVDVPVIGHHQCEQQLRQTRLGYQYQLNPGFICAGGEEGKDACKGDGGGPMVCERGGSWQLVGVVSWGIGCGQVNVPGVYVKVSHYLDWIAQITGSRF